jgi:hypothetical protein
MAALRVEVQPGEPGHKAKVWVGEEEISHLITGVSVEATASTTTADATLRAPQLTVEELRARLDEHQVPAAIEIEAEQKEAK